ncbi:MAG: hypothetical protein WAJ91_13220, partial [Rhodoplanes sp.]
ISSFQNTPHHQPDTSDMNQLNGKRYLREVEFEYRTSQGTRPTFFVLQDCRIGLSSATRNQTRNASASVTPCAGVVRSGVSASA